MHPTHTTPGKVGHVSTQCVNCPSQAARSFDVQLKVRVALLALFVGSMWATFFLSVSMPFLHLNRHGVVPRTLGGLQGILFAAVAARRAVAHQRQHWRTAGAWLAHDVAAHCEFLAGDCRRHPRRGIVCMAARRALFCAHRREWRGVRLCRLSRCTRLLHARPCLNTRRPLRGQRLWTELAVRPAAHLPGGVVAESSRWRNRWHHCRTPITTNASPSGLKFSQLRPIYRSGKATSGVARWFFSIAGRRVASRSSLPMAATPSGSLASATVRFVGN